jgi:hypothetical protein
MKFSLPEQEEPFIIYCQPVWSNRGDIVDANEFYIGVKFAKVKPEDLVRLHEYIQFHSKEEELKKFYQQKEVATRKKKTEEVMTPKYALAALPIRYQIISSREGKRSRLISAKTLNLSVFGLCAQVETIDVDGLHMVL